MGTSERGETHNMLCFYRLNKFGILGIVNMCAEGDGINGDFSWNGVAFEASELFRFSHDVLNMQTKTKKDVELNIQRGWKDSARGENEGGERKTYPFHRHIYKRWELR